MMDGCILGGGDKYGDKVFSRKFVRMGLMTVMATDADSLRFTKLGSSASLLILNW